MRGEESILFSAISRCVDDYDRSLFKRSKDLDCSFQSISSTIDGRICACVYQFNEGIKSFVQ